MGFFDTFSKRLKKAQKAGKADVYRYDELPDVLRRQVIHIWSTAIGPFVRESRYQEASKSNELWRLIHNTLARERGDFHLGYRGDDPEAQCQQFMQSSDTTDALDLIEISFKVIDRVVRDWQDYERDRARITQSPDDAIEELNHRFQEHAVGYSFTGGQLIRIDSQYMHSEVVLPAITLLCEEKFKGAADEFLRAHEHYRYGRYKEAMNEALKAFESTMKTICDRRKWPYPSTAAAKHLVDIILSNGLIPPEMASHFAGFRSALEAGLPTMRNRTSGHGQGSAPLQVPPHLVAHALHLAAANIVFLIEAHIATR